MFLFLLLILKIIVVNNLYFAYVSAHVSSPCGEETTMARLLLLEADACLWHSVWDILEGAGYTVCRAHHDDEGLPCALTGCLALTRGTVLSIVVF
jgi:hypothetical protein